MWTDRRTDTTKLIVAIRNCANGSKRHVTFSQLLTWHSRWTHKSTPVVRKPLDTTLIYLHSPSSLIVYFLEVRAAIPYQVLCLFCNWLLCKKFLRHHLPLCILVAFKLAVSQPQYDYCISLLTTMPATLNKTGLFSLDDVLNRSLKHYYSEWK
jgi:hypothetical protein